MPSTVCATETQYRENEAYWRGIHPGFEILSDRHLKFKTGISVAPQKRQVSFKNVLLLWYNSQKIDVHKL